MYKIFKKDTNENVTKRAAVTADRIILLIDEDGNYHPVNSDLYEVKEYSIPSKEAFKKIIDSIQDINRRHDKLNDVFREVCIDSILYFPTLEQTLLNYLSDVFDDNSDWIYYFICDLEYGKKWKPGMIISNGNDYKLATVDDLYNLLVENLKE